MLEGTGTYTVDPQNTFGVLTFNQQGPAGTPPIVNKANAKNNRWDKTVTIAAGNWDTWGELTTFDNNNKIFITKTSVVAVNVQ
ncbi:MAG: hypothetical protein K2V38_19370 [Gemmataceae bacterium]|nr:hypothetical protein [Gemmataceae bacterium]